MYFRATMRAFPFLWCLLALLPRASAQTPTPSPTPSPTPPSAGCGDNYAYGEFTTLGVAGNSFVETLASDNIYETLTQVPGPQFPLLDHTWVFNVPPLAAKTFYAEGYSTPSLNPVAQTEFQYAQNPGGPFTNMFTITKTADNNALQSFSLPSNLSGTIYIKLVTIQTFPIDHPPETVYIDRMYIHSSGNCPTLTPSATPTISPTCTPVAGIHDVQVSVSGCIATISFQKDCSSAVSYVVKDDNFQVVKSGTTSALSFTAPADLFASDYAGTLELTNPALCGCGTAAEVNFGYKGGGPCTPSPTPMDNWSFVSTDIPFIVQHQVTYPCQFTVQNTGTTTWDSAGGYGLFVQQVHESFSPNPILLPADVTVHPGEIYTFNFSVTGNWEIVCIPPACEDHVMISMCSNAGCFGTPHDQFIEVPIPEPTITPTRSPTPTPSSSPSPSASPSPTPLDNWAFISTDVPLVALSGVSYPCEFTVQNTGTSTWSFADGYVLSVQSNYSTVSPNPILIPEGATVPPGASYTFNFSVVGHWSAECIGFCYDQLTFSVCSNAGCFGFPYQKNLNVALPEITVTVTPTITPTRTPSPTPTHTPSPTPFVEITATCTPVVGIHNVQVVISDCMATISFEKGCDSPVAYRIEYDNFQVVAEGTTTALSFTAPANQFMDYYINLKLLNPDPCGCTTGADMYRPYGHYTGCQITPTRSATPTPSQSPIPPTPIETPTPLPTISPTPFNDASFAASTIPAQIASDHTTPVTITLLNTGNTVWSAAGGYALAVDNDGCTMTLVNSIPLDDSAAVNPGESYTFSFLLNAPATFGFACPLEFQMIQQGVGAFGPPIDAAPEVIEGIDDAIFLFDTIPPSVPPGTTIGIGVMFQNTGTTTWHPGAHVVLLPLEDSCLLIKGFYPLTIPMREGAIVPPGETYQFIFYITTPAQPGLCPLHMQMADNFLAPTQQEQGINHFGPILDFTVNVQEPLNVARDWVIYE